MKISKLFHWLYALVMLLPIFAIGCTILYTAFNKNAFESYAGNKIVKNYTTNEVNTRNDIVYGNIYHIVIDYQITSNTITEDTLLLDTPRIANVKTNMNYQATVQSTRNSYDCIKLDKTYFAYVFKDISNNDTGINYYGFRFTTGIIQFECDAIIQNDVNNNLQYYMENNFIKISSSTFLGEILFTENTYTLDNSFYYAVDKVEQSPLFNWAYNSFLAQPLVYIVTLFSIPANHVVVEFLSYWLAISIIWLVFDLIMYVPLLVHRWLDKGVLE